MEYKSYQIMVYNPLGQDLLTTDEAAFFCHVHPSFVLRLAEQGLIEPVAMVNSVYYFKPGVVDEIKRARRLHNDLGINWAGVGLALDLLDRIDQLEKEVARLRRLFNQG